MAPQKATGKLDWSAGVRDSVVRTMTTFGKMEPAQASLVEKAATMLTDQSETPPPENVVRLPGSGAA